MLRFLILLSLVLIPPSAHAMFIARFLKSPDDQQHAYALGATSMLAYSEFQQGYEKRSACIVDWWKGEGEDQFFRSVNYGPDKLKSRFDLDRETGHVERLISRLTHDACH